MARQYIELRQYHESSEEYAQWHIKLPRLPWPVRAMDWIWRRVFFQGSFLPPVYIQLRLLPVDEEPRIEVLE